VQAIAISAQMAGVGIVDENHVPLAPFDSWLDTRCGDVVGDLSPYADAVVASSGCAPTISIGPKMAWWHRHHPDVCEAAASFVTAAGYVAAIACGRDGHSAFIDPTHLHFASVTDVANARWNTELIDAFGLDPDLMPEIIESTDMVGHLNATTAAEFGLRPGTPIAAGCGDTAASALGAGALDPGTALDVAGTAAVFAAGTDEFVPDIAHRTLMTMRAAIPGHWYALAYVGGAGQVIEWVCREILGFSEVDDEAYAALGATAATAEPGCAGLSMSPHFDGRVTPAAPHMRGSIVGLGHSHGRAELARAALESIAFEYRTYLDIIHELQPEWRLRRVIGAGGGSHSPTWNQIKADTLGAEYVPIVDADPGTRGAALVAIAALGHELPDIPATQLDTAIQPDQRTTATYDRLHSEYARWDRHLAEGYRQTETAPTDPTQ
jgi:xylulokinase